ncbi:hypothetical protein MMC29_005693 [Sticta canariensis]|nr:hypothetical protein [Sticta canariensis]
MRYHFTSLLAVVFCIAAASAQSLNDIPSCATTAAVESISSTKCEITDYKCICNNKAWITSLLPKIEKVCNADDLKKTEDFALKLCAAQSVTLSFSDTASATGSTASSIAIQATSTSASAAGNTTTPFVSAAAATVGYSVQKRGTGALLGMFGVAFGMAAWC